MHTSKRNLEATLLLLFSLFFALPTWGATANIVAGWNLLGNSSSAALDVASAFGNSTQVTTVWKWVPSKSVWAFYAPSLDGGAAYATTKGYDPLTTVNAGEGFWVNAKTAFTAQLPAGTSVTSASFRTTLLPGWNLVASGDNNTPSQFNQALSVAPPPFGTTPINLITLWSWNAPLTSWYFYAPSLEASGGTALSDYATSKGYVDFGTKTIDPAMGFWVNRSSPPASIALASTSASSASPMSILTLNGTGFDTTAMTSVRFSHAANQYSVDVRPVRVSSTTIAVTVPPYFNATTAVFTPGTVSVQVIQTSGAGTRSSTALAGFQILDLPNPAAPAGAVTLNFLQSLQANTTALQTSAAGTALGALLSSSLTDQASALSLLINTLQPVVGTSARATLGTVNGVSISLGAAELLQTDRLLLGTFMALASGSSTTVVNAGGTAIARGPGEPPGTGGASTMLSKAARGGAPLQLAYNGALDQLGIGALVKGLLDGSSQGNSSNAMRNAVIQLAQTSSSGIPMQAEAYAYTQCLLSSDVALCSAQPTLRAPQETAPGRLPGATGTALTIVGASLVGAVAIAALVGTPVAATAGVLALTGYLAYATVFTGLAQISMGGTLGQTSADAKLLVSGGLKQLNDFVRDTTISIGVGAAAGETAGLLNDVVTAGKNVRDALEQAASPATVTTTTQTTSTTTTSTTTTTIGWDACYAKYQTCTAQAACNPPSDLITQSNCVNACLGAWNNCY